jgi:protein-S-isoprenylcysteine O-methyltransferase Ste14
LIRREEAALVETQGEPYRAYLAAVPALIPSLTPRLPSGGKEPRWGQAFLGELFFWLFAVSIAAFAITLKAAVLYVAIGAALVARAVTLALIRWNKYRRESLNAPRAP